MLNIRMRTRPHTAEDEPKLKEWQEKFENGNLETPFGFENRNVETAVAELDGKLVSSLTGTVVFALGPLIQNPEASPADALLALFALCASLEYRASRLGCREVYITVPNELEKYQQLLTERCGFELTGENCKVYSRKL